MGRKGCGPYGQWWQVLHGWDGEAESGEKTWSRKAQDESAGCGTSQGVISQMAAGRLDAGKRHSEYTSRDFQDKGWPVSLQEL